MPLVIRASNIQKFLLGALIVVFAGGCAAAPSVAPAAAPAKPYKDIRQSNFTPFPSALWVSELGGVLFYTGMLKATLELVPDGGTRYAAEQPQLEMKLEASYGCHGETVEVPAIAPFKQKAEIYVRAGAASLNPESALRFGNERVPFLDHEKCQRLSSPDAPLLLPFPGEGDAFEFSGIAGAGGRFVIPQNSMPFLTVRYDSGAMRPVPLRIDTALLDVDERKLTLIYRSTFPVEPAVKKVEFRFLQERQAPWPGESADQTTERIRRSFAYLRSCPAPAVPPEECSKPERAVDPAFFGKL